MIRGTHVDFPDGTKGQIEGEEGNGRRSGTPPPSILYIFIRIKNADKHTERKRRN